jgi:hypothetical protein
MNKERNPLSHVISSPNNEEQERLLFLLTRSESPLHNPQMIEPRVLYNTQILTCIQPPGSLPQILICFMIQMDSHHRSRSSHVLYNAHSFAIVKPSCPRPPYVSTRILLLGYGGLVFVSFRFRSWLAGRVLCKTRLGCFLQLSLDMSLPLALRG